MKLASYSVTYSPSEVGMKSFISPSTLLLICFIFLFIAIYRNPILRHPSQTKQLQKQSDPPYPRTGHNILYWKPHKTGSTSTKIWLSQLANESNLIYNFFSPKRYVYQEPTDLATRAENFNCTIIVGHILTRPVNIRRNEARFGVVLTTTRNVYNYLCSKYFHTTEAKFRFAIRELNSTTSESSRRWWSSWLIYDPCETYRYYDGLDGCDTDQDALRARAEAIASRIDCVIDIEDPQADADAICKVMGVRDCPRFGAVNLRVDVESGYSKLLNIPHVKKLLDRPARVIQILRDALMKRRCRFMTASGAFDSSSTIGNLPPARWPTVSCQSN